MPMSLAMAYMRPRTAPALTLHTLLNAVPGLELQHSRPRQRVESSICVRPSLNALGY